MLYYVMLWRQVLSYNQKSFFLLFLLIFVSVSSSDAKEGKKGNNVLPEFIITVLTQEIGTDASSVVPSDLATFWNVIEIDGTAFIPKVYCKRIDKTPELEFFINRPDDDVFIEGRKKIGSWSEINERLHLLSKVGKQKIGENFSVKTKDITEPKELEERVIEYEKNIGDGALFVYMKNSQNTAPEISVGSLKGKVFNNSGELMETFKQKLIADVKADRKELHYLILYNLELPQFVGFDEVKTASESKESKGATKEQTQRSNMSGNILSEAKGHLQQGMIYAKLNDYENAIKEFSLAIEKQPDYAMAYSSRAAAYMQQKKLNKAFDDLTKACQIETTEPIIYYNLTSVLSLQQKIDLALDSLDKCLDLGFNDYDSLRTDPDLVNLRKHPEYKKILNKHKIPIK